MARDLRIEGIYEQAQEGFYMLRTKVPGGVLSAEQARKVCEISERFSNGIVHLTTRMSVEFHWLREDDLAEVSRMLQAVGLTSRGACGGAVRGVAVSTPFALHYPHVQALARRIHAHFTGNPHFERLPKKFKVGVDAGYEGSRHLIQDVGLVCAGVDGDAARYDVWMAGGLGRAPAEAFLVERGVPEPRVLPLIEAAVRVHRLHTPQGKRLKHLVREIGKDGLVNLVRRELGAIEDLPLADSFPKHVTPTNPGENTTYLTARVFAGELPTSALRKLADFANQYSDGFLVLTPDQDVALAIADPATLPESERAWIEAGFGGQKLEDQVVFRVCPGNHECRAGLAPTRDVARAVIRAMRSERRAHTWAVSGCFNSCSQPQLADVGILCRRLAKDEEGTRIPLFDLLRRDGEGFGRPVVQGAPMEKLLEAVRAMV